MRSGLRTLIGGLKDYALVGEAGTLAEGRSLIDERRPTVVLLDISLPDGSGLDILAEHQTAKSGPHFIVLTMHKESPYLARAIELGASGFVLKDMATEHLIETLRAVERGERKIAVPATLAAEAAGMAALSPREKKVKELLVEGRSLTDIGKELGLSVKTISTYRTRILLKLGLKNNAELIKHTMIS